MTSIHTNPTRQRGSGGDPPRWRVGRGRGHCARSTVFHKPDDYRAFVQIMSEASIRIPMRILAYGLMPNHFHLALWPREDGDLSRWMHRLLTTHVRRYRRHDHSGGHIGQGRFKALPIEGDEHLLAVLRSIERNPLRAHLVERAEARPWSRLPWLSDPGEAPVRLDAGTVPRGSRWIDGVNESSTDREVERVRECIRRDRPFGSPGWAVATARGLGLESSLRSGGRPHGPGSDQSSPAAEDGTSSSG